jgi:hypothetical protein
MTTEAFKEILVEKTEKFIHAPFHQDILRVWFLFPLLLGEGKGEVI